MYHDEKEIYCEVLVDDNQLEEFQPKVDDTDCECWIIAEEGKRYQVSIYNERYSVDDFMAQLFIDGNDEASGVVEAPCFDTAVFQGWESDGGALHPFIFAPINTHAEDESASADDELSTLSSLRIEVWRVEYTRTLPRRRVKPVKFRSLDSVCEKAATKDHGICDRTTKLGNPIRTALTEENETFRGYDFLDDEPYVTFAFKYRSREALEALEIIPRPPPVTENNDDAVQRETVTVLDSLPEPEASPEPKIEEGAPASEEFLQAQALIANMSHEERMRLFGGAGIKDEDVKVEDGVEVVHKRKRRRFTKEDNVVVDLTEE